LIRTILLCLTGLSLLVGTAWSGPLYDPFLERFQVGTYHDPAEIVLDGGFPSDLLDPVLIDTVWTAAARRVLSSQGTDADSFLTRRLLDQRPDDAALTLWLDRMEGVIDQLESGTLPGNWDEDTDPLLAERSNRAVFAHLADGRVMQAAALAIRLRDRGGDLGLSDREIFVWDLRAKRLFRLAGNKPVHLGSSWPTMLALGSYDAGNAWALWMAHCRDTGVQSLPSVMTTEKWGRRLAGINRTWLTPDELYGSGFSLDFQAGLGSVMFKGTDRDAHFLKFPVPPADNSLQGLWIRGRRLQSGGDAATYEQLAGRPDIRPGWSMDTWRRASELRLLKGEWEQGLDDLRQALELAASGQGHRSTRRRLRQWNEQALVLALAQDDTATARRLRNLGLQHFKGPDRETFIRETDHWAERLGPGAAEPLVPVEGLPNQARILVETGQAEDLAPVDGSRQEQFRMAAGHSLWRLWASWGITLANPEPVQGRKRERAILYRDALLGMLEESDPARIETAALGIVAGRLGDSPVFDRMLAQAFDRDVGMAAAGKTLPEPSVVPAVLPLLRGSELDRHALLGFALAIGDMRGILAVATELEGRGLTPEEKRRFLYPLPDTGAIHAAITEAASDPALLLAVARNESLFEPSVRSRAGALGWMQIMPFHFEERGALPGEANWRNPGISIRHGDGLLRENSRRYQGNPYLAIAAYNAGPRAASRWERQLGGSSERDIYLAWIGYPETRHYVEKVLIDREIYDWIIGAE
jgi:soluble lytic murein transglycosylase